MRAALEARLKERLAEAAADFKRTFGVAPGRLLQMEAQHGTMGACQRILASDEFVTQLTPLWEKRRRYSHARRAACPRVSANQRPRHSRVGRGAVAAASGWADVGAAQAGLEQRPLSARVPRGSQPQRALPSI